MSEKEITLKFTEEAYKFIQSAITVRMLSQGGCNNSLDGFLVLLLEKLKEGQEVWEVKKR